MILTFSVSSGSAVAAEAAAGEEDDSSDGDDGSVVVSEEASSEVREEASSADVDAAAEVEAAAELVDGFGVSVVLSAGAHSVVEFETGLSGSAWSVTSLATETESLEALSSESEVNVASGRFGNSLKELRSSSPSCSGIAKSSSSSCAQMT